MLTWLLPIRYLLRRRITLLAILSVALCVFIVVVVMTVMNGLVENFRHKNHRYAGDCVISTDSLVGFAHYENLLERLAVAPFVEAVSPVARGYGLLSRPRSEQNLGAEIIGIDPARHSRATGFGQTLHYHQKNPARAFTPSYAPDRPGCVVGIDKMWWQRERDGTYRHAAQPPQMELTVSTFPLTAKGALARADLDAVLTESFFYSDDSHSGLVKVDGNAVYVSLERAQQLFGMSGSAPRISAVHIRFKSDAGLVNGTRAVQGIWNAFVADHHDKPYANLFDNVRVEDWITHRRGTIAPMQKEQTMLILLFLMLGVITVFIIFVVFTMIVGHKSRDIGILKSVGVSSRAVATVFFVFAMLVGLAGAVFGAGAGCLFLTQINSVEGWLYEKFHWELWDRQVYAIGRIPDRIEWPVIGVIVGLAVVACLVGALAPATRAARRRPVEILQVAQL